MKQCHYGTCPEIVFRINPKTSKPFYYCDKHLETRRTDGSESYIRRKDSILQKAQVKYSKIRMQFFEMYGTQCACCGEDHIEFLSLEHVQGGGKKHRKIKTGMAIHREAIKEYRPDLYKTLCHNCNFTIGIYGTCPHVVPVEYKHRPFLGSDTDNQKNLKRQHNLRIKFFDLYGNQCSCCGESNKVFLSLDHVNGGGRKHRDECGGLYKIYNDASSIYRPDLYQILCYNCNFGKHMKLECPHKLLCAVIKEI